MTDYDLLSQKLSEKEKELNDLRIQYEEFKQDVQDYQEELEQDNQHKEKEINEFKNKIELLKKRMDELKLENNKINTIYEREKENSSRLLKQIQEFKNKIIELEQKNDELENEKRNYYFEKVELEENLHALEEKHIIEMEDVWSQLGVKIEEIEKLKQENIDLYDEVQVMKLKLNQIVQDPISNYNNNNNIDNNTSPNAHTSCLDQIEKYKNQIDVLNIQMNDINMQYEQKLLLINSLENEIERFKKQSLLDEKNSGDGNNDHYVKDHVSTNNNNNNNALSANDGNNDKEMILTSRNQELENELALKTLDILEKTKEIQKLRKEIENFKDELLKSSTANLISNHNTKPSWGHSPKIKYSPGHVIKNNHSDESLNGVIVNGNKRSNKLLHAHIPKTHGNNNELPQSRERLQTENIKNNAMLFDNETIRNHKASMTSSYYVLPNHKKHSKQKLSHIEFITPKLDKNLIFDEVFDDKIITSYISSEKKILSLTKKSKKDRKMLIIKGNGKLPSSVVIKSGSLSFSTNKIGKVYGFDKIYQNLDFNFTSYHEEDANEVLGKNLFYMIYGPRKTDKKNIKYKILEEYISLFLSIAKNDKFKENQHKIKIKIEDYSLMRKVSAINCGDISLLEKENEFILNEDGIQQLHSFLDDLKYMDIQRYKPTGYEDSKKMNKPSKKIFIEFLLDNISCNTINKKKKNSNATNTVSTNTSNGISSNTNTNNDMSNGKSQYYGNNQCQNDLNEENHKLENDDDDILDNTNYNIKLMIITSTNIYTEDHFKGLISIPAILDYLINGNKAFALKKNNQEFEGIEQNFIMTINIHNLQDKIMIDTMNLSQKLSKCIGFIENNNNNVKKFIDQQHIIHQGQQQHITHHVNNNNKIEIDKISSTSGTGSIHDKPMIKNASHPCIGIMNKKDVNAKESKDIMQSSLKKTVLSNTLDQTKRSNHGAKKSSSASKQNIKDQTSPCSNQRLSMKKLELHNHVENTRSRNSLHSLSTKHLQNYQTEVGDRIGGEGEGDRIRGEGGDRTRGK